MTRSRTSRPARSGASPWFLASLGIVLSFTAVRSFRRGVPDWLAGLTGAAGTPATVAELRGPGADTLAGWRGSTEFAGGSVSVRLVPYHAFPFIEAYRSDRLRERMGLEEGMLFRLIVERREPTIVPPGAPDGTRTVRISSFQILHAEDVALRDLASLIGPDVNRPPGDPLIALLGRPLAELEPGASGQLAAWGEAPGRDARLVLDIEGSAVEMTLEAVEFASRDLPRSLVLPAGPGPRESGAELSGAKDLLERVLELEGDLAEERARVARLEEQHREREEAFLGFQQVVAGLPVDLPASLRDRIATAESAELDPGENVSPTREELRAAAERERSAEIAVSIRALFKLEGLFALDLLEVGELRRAPESGGSLDGGSAKEDTSPDPAPFGTGPVIFRMLDGRGRLTGSLFAERLHLEGSRSARTLTVVLSSGYESRGQTRTPFAGGERRITLPFVDPDPWRERVPELFPPAALRAENDDGLWDLGALRSDLNELLGVASARGWFRVHGLGGVQGSTITGVHLVDFDASGHRERRIFADRLRLRMGEEGVSLLFEDGAVHDSAGVHPFRDGFYRIYLPRADPAVWSAARLPRSKDGLSGEESDAAEPDEGR